MVVSEASEPRGELMIRTLAMPADTNPNGDIFGGWLVSQMDLASSSLAQNIAGSRVVTVAINSMAFLSPVKIGDFVCCYADLIDIHRTSMEINVEAWVLRMPDQTRQRVTQGIFTFVALDEKGRPKQINK